MKRFLISLSLIALLSCNGDATGQTPSPMVPYPQTYGGIPIPNYTANAGLPHWKACLASFKAGTSAACNNSGGPVIMVWGDSQSTGHNSFYTGITNDSRSGAWSMQLATLFNLPGNNLSTIISTASGTNNITPGTNSYDWRVTPGGWTGYNGTFTIGGQFWLNNDATAFTFNPSDYLAYQQTPAINTNALDVIWAGNNGQANLIVTATQNSGTSGTATTSSTTLTFASAPAVAPNTGASAFIYGPGIAVGTTVSAYNAGTLTMTLSTAASVPAGSTLSFNPATIGTIPENNPSLVVRLTTLTTPLGPSVYTITCSSSAQACAFLALRAYDSSKQSITVFQAAADGSTTAQWASNNSFATDPTATASVLLPDLIIYGEVANSAAAQTAIATYETDLTYIITASKAAVAGVSGKSTDVLLNTGFPSGTNSSPLTLQQYQAAVGVVGVGQSVPVWDSMSAFGGTPSGWLNFSANGGYGCCQNNDDLSHPGVALNAIAGTYYAQILLQ